MKTTRIITLPLLLLGSIALTACGGGSGSDTGSNTGNTGGTGSTGGTGGTGSNNNTVTLSASVVQNTVCNTQVSASSAELVVYDNNWAIKSRHPVDANGNITATIPQASTVNISLIGTTGSGTSRQINVDSFSQHPVGDLGVYTVPGTTTQGCECQTTDISVMSELGRLYYGAQVSGLNQDKLYDSATANGNGITYFGVEVCRVAGEQWPTLYAATQPQEDFHAAGYLSDYDPTAPLTIVLEQSPTTYSVNFDPASSFTSVTHNFGEAYIGSRTTYISPDIQLYDNLPGLTAISLRASDSIIYHLDGLTVDAGRMQRYSLVPPYSSAVDVDLPNENSPATFMQGIINWLDSENTRYDFSNINGFETFSISLSATLTDGSRYQQNFFGPKRGDIPEEVLPSDYGVDDLLDEENFSIYASMLRYGDQQTYQQYLQSKTNASRMTTSERLLGDRSQFHQIFVNITL